MHCIAQVSEETGGHSPRVEAPAHALDFDQQSTSSYTNPSLSILRKIFGHYFGHNYDTRSERWFLFKLDLFLLLSSCLGYFIRSLDTSNLGNAYVSGMQEDLRMNGNQLTYAYNVAVAGYVLLAIPVSIVVTKVRPSWIIPLFELMLAGTTLLTYRVATVSQLYVVRFFVGFFESAFFPVMVHLIASWYPKPRRVKRVAMFYASSYLAAMFSGYLQAAIYTHLDGVLGHAGWRWLFIVCGIISAPVAFMSFFLIPDYPENSRAWYLSKAEIQSARERLAQSGLSPLGQSPWNKHKIPQVLGRWQTWTLPAGYFMIWASSITYQPVFALWLKSEGHSVVDINVWPTAQIALGLVVLLVATLYLDSQYGQRHLWLVAIVMQTGTLCSAAVLLVWNVSTTCKYGAYLFSYMGSGVPALYLAWFPDLIPDDHETRGFVVALSNTFSCIMSIWFVDVCWRTSESPRYTRGFAAICGSSVGVMALVWILHYLQCHRRQ